VETQIRWLVLGTVTMFAMTATDYRVLYRGAYAAYALGVGLLMLVPFFGITVNNAKRWLGTSDWRIQPSELMKVFVILALARYLHDAASRESRSFKRLLAPFGMLVLPFALIARQPDLGTGVFVCCRAVVAHVQFYSVGHLNAAPDRRLFVVLRHSLIRSRTKCGCQRSSHFALQRITGEISQLLADNIEGVSFALSDFYRHQLQQVPVVVGGRGAGSFRVVHQPAGHVEPHPACGEHRSRGSVGWLYAGGVDQRVHVRGKPTGIPWSVTGVSPEK
jgi:hypothetical protein